MPLTKSGTKVLASMKEQYGTEKGERVFYATANKRSGVGKSWHATRSPRRGRR